MQHEFCPRCSRVSQHSSFPSPSLGGLPPPYPSGRNLVVCIDGTSNQFGLKNTNVIELYSQLSNDVEQLTYYNSGIGTYARLPKTSIHQRLRVITNKLDMMVANHFSKTVRRAYLWLAENYQDNDRIYLFGFSRGAYQVRTLAAMIRKVGLIRKGNEEQIMFAYALYVDPKTDDAPTINKSSNDEDSFEPTGPAGYFDLKTDDFSTGEKNLSDEGGAPGHSKKGRSRARVFKDTFSRDVPVHFIGIWDTVSSIGFIRGDPLPGTNDPSCACLFRHALALDERRVKFLPEYARGGKMLDEQTEDHDVSKDTDDDDDARPEATTSASDADIKEVWFSGTHSDIGGGHVENKDLNLGTAPAVWMSWEALRAGIKFRGGEPNFGNWASVGEIHESLKGWWKWLEYMPVRRLSYATKDSVTRHCHWGQGRLIQDGQKIHISVALCRPDQLPKAILPKDPGTQDAPRWEELVGNSGAFRWERRWDQLVEFDASAAGILIEKIVKPSRDLEKCLPLLTAMASSDKGREQLRNIETSVVRLFYAIKTRELGHVNNGPLMLLKALSMIGMASADEARLNRAPDDGVQTEISKLLEQRPEGFLSVIGFLDPFHISMPKWLATLIRDEVVHVPADTLCNQSGQIRYASLRALNATVEHDKRRCEVSQIVVDNLNTLFTECSQPILEQIRLLLLAQARHDDSRPIVLKSLPLLLAKSSRLDNAELMRELYIGILEKSRESDGDFQRLLDGGFLELAQICQEGSVDLRGRCFEVVGRLFEEGGARINGKLISSFLRSTAPRTAGQFRYLKYLAFLGRMLKSNVLRERFLNENIIVSLPELLKEDFFSPPCLKQLAEWVDEYEDIRQRLAHSQLESILSDWIGRDRGNDETSPDRFGLKFARNIFEKLCSAKILDANNSTADSSNLVVAAATTEFAERKDHIISPHAIFARSRRGSVYDSLMRVLSPWAAGEPY